MCPFRSRKTIAFEQERTGPHTETQVNKTEQVSLLRALELKTANSLFSLEMKQQTFALFM